MHMKMRHSILKVEGGDHVLLRWLLRCVRLIIVLDGVREGIVHTDFMVFSQPF